LHFHNDKLTRSILLLIIGGPGFLLLSTWPAAGIVAGDLMALFKSLQTEVAPPSMAVLGDTVFEFLNSHVLASLGLTSLPLARVAPPEQHKDLRVLHYMGTNFGMTGVETFILQLTAAQKRSGLTPSIVMDLDNREDVRLIGRDRDIAVHDLPSRGIGETRLPRKLGTAMLRVRRIQALRRLLKTNDILHIQAVGISCLDGFIAAALTGVPVVVTHHGTLSWFAPQRDRLADATFWIEKRLASTIAMPYAAAVAELTDEGIPTDQSEVIPFCVDEQAFSGASAQPRDGELKLVLVARMVEGKGHIDLLGALSKVSPRHPGVRAIFLGDGPMRGAVEAEIDRLGLRQIVECKGKVDHRDVPAVMRTAHVVVLPTYETGEMFPLCLLEGMALGLPAIGTRWSGIPDIIEDGVSGIIVEPRDEASLVSAIERFLREPDFFAQAGQAARERARSRFTATAVAESYTKSYFAALTRV
jgi:glycosyltransferase involved in cell wall biosynthesis